MLVQQTIPTNDRALGTHYLLGLILTNINITVLRFSKPL